MRISALLVLVAALFGPQPAAAGGDHEAPHDQLLVGARKLDAHAAYATHCASCHGEKGDGLGRDRGAGAVPDFTTPAAVASMTREGMIEALDTAHDAQLASAWQEALGPEAREHLIDYVREAFMLPAPVADASVGRKIYARRCSVCHGERGNAASWARNSLNPPPRDFTAPAARRLSRQEMINTVTYGNANTAMMPFATRFTREEIAAVVDYIRATFVQTADQGDPHGGQLALAPTGPAGHDHAAHGHEAGMEAGFPGDLAGRREAGQRFYDDNCAECHGLKGDGQGPRAYFMTRKPRDFTSGKARAELSRAHLFAAISKGVVGTEMAAWSKVIGDQEIADVSEYVFRAFIRPEDPNAPTAAPSWRHSESAEPGKKKN